VRKNLFEIATASLAGSLAMTEGLYCHASLWLARNDSFFRCHCEEQKVSLRAVAKQSLTISVIASLLRSRRRGNLVFSEKYFFKRIEIATPAFGGLAMIILVVVLPK